MCPKVSAAIAAKRANHGKMQIRSDSEYEVNQVHKLQSGGSVGQGMGNTDLWLEMHEELRTECMHEWHMHEFYGMLDR